MWNDSDTGTNAEHLSHDLPCAECGHAGHYYLPCDRDCGCRVAERELVPVRVLRR